MNPLKAFWKGLANTIVAGIFVLSYLFAPIAPLVPTWAEQFFIPVEKAEAATFSASVDWNDVSKNGTNDQVIDGFGASFVTIAETFYNKVNKPWIASLMDKLFDPNLGIGLSIVNVEITADDHDKNDTVSANDGTKWRSWINSIKPTEAGGYEIATQASGSALTNDCGTGYESTHDKHQVWLMCEAKKRFAGMKFKASVWSPPPYMKENNSFRGNTTGGNGEYNAYVKTDKYDAYADYLATYVKEYRDKFGINISQLAPMYEPDFVPYYQGALWTPNQTIAFLPKLSSALSSKGVNTSVSLPEMSRWFGALVNGPEWGSNNEGVTKILNAVPGSVGVISLHGYDQIEHYNSTGSNYFRPVTIAESKGKKVWQTEMAMRTGPGNNMTTALYLAENIHKNLVNARANAWLFWTAVSNWCWEACLAQVQGPGDTNGYDETKMLYALGNYSKFIRPGAVRLETGATPATDLYTSAYKENATGQFVYVAVNKSASSHTITINVANNPGFTQLTPFITDDTRNLAPQAKVNVGSSYTIPANSIVTFVRNTNVVSQIAPTATITSPLNGANYPTAPASITFNVNAIDSDGSVSKVEFFNGQTKLGEDTTAPYSFTWNSVAQGTYTIVARATDNAGATGDSGGVQVTVGTVVLPPASISTFIGSPTSITPGQSASFTWSSINSTSCELSANGVVTTGLQTGVQAYIVNPSTTTTYTLKCLGTGGPSSPQSVTINVTGGDQLGVSIVSPQNGASFTQGTAIPLTAAVSIPTVAVKDSQGFLASAFDAVYTLITFPGRLILSLFSEPSSPVVESVNKIATTANKSISSVAPTSQLGAAVVVTSPGAGKFRLDVSAVTSAGIFRKSDGALVRTLWSNQSKAANVDHTISWDGKDDSGASLSPVSNYEARVVAHNVSYVWDGAVGNSSSDLTGKRIYRAFEPVADIAIHGNRAVYAVGYNELQYLAFSFDTTNPRVTTAILADDCKATLRSVTIDATSAYFGDNGTDGGPCDDHSRDRVILTNPNGDALTSNNPITAWYGAGGNTQALAVQKNGTKIFVARVGGSVAIKNKATGADSGSIGVTAIALATNSAGEVWVADQGNGSVSKYSETGTKLLTLSGITKGLGLAVDPSDNVLVADGGTHQLKQFSNNGTLIRTYGQSGGYATGGPKVTYDKFLFKRHVPMAAGSDGSFWIGDTDNNRIIHLSSSFVAIPNDTIMYIPHLYMSTVDMNDPTRVFAGYQEFKIDYSKSLTNGGWELVNNWGAGITDANLFQGLTAGVQHAVTINGRTFAMLLGGRPQKLYELPNDGRPAQFIKTLDGWPGFYDFPSFGKDGSIRYFRNTGSRQDILQKDLIVNGTSVTLGAEKLIASAPAGTSEPQFGVAADPTGVLYGITDSGIFTIYEPWRANKFHLGGVKTIAAGGSATGGWTWKTFPSGKFNITMPGEQNPVVNCYADKQTVINAFTYGTPNNQYDATSEYGGTRVNTLGKTVIAGYLGEFFRKYQSPDLGGCGHQAPIQTQFYENGLMIGQFGRVSATPVNRDIALPGYAGNAMTPVATMGPNGKGYMYINDESAWGGVQRWTINGMDTITEMKVSLDGSVTTPTNPTASLTANPSSVQVNTPFTLNWSSTDATNGCVGSGGSFNTNGATSGQQSITPTSAGTYNYTLTCKGATGTTDAVKTVSVVASNITVVPSPSVTMTRTPATGSVSSGSSVTIAWAPTNVTSCTAGGAWSGPKSTTISSELVAVSGAGTTKTFTITCQGQTGSVPSSASAQVSVDVTSTQTTGYRVEFWDGAVSSGTKIGEVSSAPYTVNWTNASVANHTVIARVINLADTTKTAVSSPITVKVTPGGINPGDGGSSNDGTREFVKGINFGPKSGSVVANAVTVEGNAWIGQATAEASGLTYTGNPRLTATAVTPASNVASTTAADSSNMLNTNMVWGATGGVVNQTIANGTYEVFLYSMENYQPNFRKYGINVEGQITDTVFPNQNFAVGQWAKYGPYKVNVTDGALTVTVGPTSTGDPQLMGMAIYKPVTVVVNPLDPTKGDLQVSLIGTNFQPINIPASVGGNQIKFGSVSTTTNNAIFRNVLGSNTFSVPQVPGYGITLGVCTYPRGSAECNNTSMNLYGPVNNGITCANGFCSGSNGVTQGVVTKALVMYVPGAPIINITAPASVASGSNVPLTWTTAVLPAGSGTTVTAPVNCIASGSWVGTKNASGSETITNLTSPGTFTLTCDSRVAFTSVGRSDNVRATKSVTVDITGIVNPAPTVSLSSPQAGTGTIYEGSTLTLDATVSGGGTIQKVEFYNKGTLLGQATANGAGVWRYNYTNIPGGGGYEFKAVATDNKGVIGSSNIMQANVTSLAESDPVLKIVGATSVPVGSAVTAQVINRYDLNKDPSFTIHGVDFYLDGVKVGSRVTTYPATMSITLTTAGNHKISAKLVETFSGQQGEDISNTVDVTAVGSTPSVSSTPTFFKGINFGPKSGSVVANAVTVEGNAWIGQATAEASGLTYTGNPRLTATAVTPTSAVPNTSTGDATNMLNTNMVWLGTGGTVNQTIANGTYDVYLYSMENYLPNFRKYAVNVEGKTDTVFPNQNFAVGQWAKYGPYRVNVADGSLTVVVGPSSAGDPQLMGMAIYQVPAGTASISDIDLSTAKYIILALLALIAISLAAIVIHHHKAVANIPPRM